MRSLVSFLALAGFLSGVRADTCDDVEATSNIQVSRPLSVSYIAEQQEYWSTSCAALKPTCIFFPTTAQEVATIVRQLNKNPGEPFAIKSGGHNPNNYWSSVEGGPIISTAKLDQVLLDQETGVVRIGPGQRLDSMAAALDGTGWTVVGGRIGNTGVGGLVLGGGLSYMSAQYGWTASTVIEYEIVLADGSVVTASEDSHPDLYLALKGGGNNFGIVTTYVIQAQPQGDIWGGNLVFLRTPEVDRKLLQAVRDFAEYNDDPRAAVIVTAERSTVSLIDTWILFHFYDGVDVPEGIFKNFTDAGIPTLDTRKVQSYSSLIGGSNWVIVQGSVVQIATETIPVPPNPQTEAIDVNVMEELHAHWREKAGSTQLLPGIVASIAYQPFQKSIARAAQAAGQDLIDADDAADRIIIEMNYSFIPQTSYEYMADVMESTYTGVRERIVDWQADGTLPDVYLPIFMNYGFYRQDYWSRLRPESRTFARSVAEEYDPEGLFRDRTGGWKP